MMLNNKANTFLCRAVVVHVSLAVRARAVLQEDRKMCVFHSAKENILVSNM